MVKNILVNSPKMQSFNMILSLWNFYTDANLYIHYGALTLSIHIVVVVLG